MAVASRAPQIELPRRTTGDPSTVTLARVDRTVGSAGRPRLWLTAAPIAAEPGAVDVRALSFLSPETLERLPLRAVTATQEEHALVIEAEVTAPTAHLAGQKAALVVLRGSPDVTDALPPPESVVGGIDYMARDFDSFRTLMLDRITSLTPTWTDRTPADLGVMLTEVLAYLADNLTYYQDAVATDAYLTTARRRLSVRRHTRLLDYWLDQGVGARVWVQFSAHGYLTVPRGTELLAAPPGLPVVEKGSINYQQQRARATAVFETMTDLYVQPPLAEMKIWDRGRRNYVVAAGATSVEIVDPAREGQLLADLLVPGAVLLFMPQTAGDAPPHPVRLTAVKSLQDPRPPGGRTTEPPRRLRLEWSREDAPSRDIQVTRTVDGVVQQNLTVLTGNIVLADFGESTKYDLPVRKSVDVPYEPQLPYSIVSLAGPAPTTTQSAARSTDIAQEEVTPAIVLEEYADLTSLGEGGARPWTRDSLGPAAKAKDRPPTRVPELIAKGKWTPVPDLLLSGPYSQVFVAEAQERGWSLRFGDGVMGRPAPLGSMFVAFFRSGDTSQSNVGVRALTTIVAKSDEFDDWVFQGLGASNPLPATGGRGAETIAHAKQNAPALLQQIDAAITLNDYATIALRVNGVADAAAALRWTGSWLTSFVYVRIDPDAADPDGVRAEVRETLGDARVAGRAILVRDPTWVALDVTLRVQRAAGFSREQVAAALRNLFVAQATGSRPAGFFDPSRWKFGETVFSSAILTWAKGVRGVASVELGRLSRVTDQTPRKAVPESLAMGAGELPQLLDVPFQPQTGTLRIQFDDIEEVES